MNRTLVVVSLLAAAVPSLAAPRWNALPSEARAPAANPTTPEKVELGRTLFFDPRLSENGSVACVSCHDLAHGGADNRATSIGVHGEHDGRNALTVWNVGFLTSLYWDGRSASLEDQARSHLLNPIDMGMKDLAYVTARLRSIGGYRPLFERAFGPANPVSAEHAADAIAAFERTLISGGTPYDRYAAGDATALDAQQLRGLALFHDVGCGRCHQGAAFDGPPLRAGTAFTMRFPSNLRSPFVATFQLAADQGRFEWTGKEVDRAQWRVPSLRNLTSTAPYFHNGAVPTLGQAVRVMGSTELSTTLTDAEVADIVAFLGALSAPLPAIAEPVLPDMH